MIEKPKRIYIYNNSLIFAYRIKYSQWKNEYFDGQAWECWDEWNISIGFEPVWFAIDNWYYDGHTSKGITLCGITLRKSYSYESKAKDVQDH